MNPTTRKSEMPELTRLQAHLTRLERRVKLLQAVLPYGEHNDDCEWLLPDPDSECTCGFFDAMEAYRTAGEVPCTCSAVEGCECDVCQGLMHAADCPKAAGEVTQ